MRHQAAALLMLLAVGTATPVRGQDLSADDLFDPSVVHDLALHISARDWQALHDHYLDNTYYPCDVEWRGLRVRNAGCKSRGSSSRNPVKPGIRIQFDRYVSEQTFLGLQALVLRNFWQDPSMLHEPLAMALLRGMGVAAPREAYVRLFIPETGQYAGLYSFVEDEDVSFVERNFGDGSGDLFEYTLVTPYRLEDLGDDLDAYAARFSPKTHSDHSAFDLFAPIRAMVRTIADTPAGDLTSALAPHLDLDLFLRQAAAENVLGEWDGLLGDLGMSNVYLYRVPGRLPFRFLPWDKDHTFERVDMPVWHNLRENALMAKVWEEPTLRRRYLQHVLEAAAQLTAMLPECDRTTARIERSAQFDQVKPYDADTMRAAMAEVRRFIDTREAAVRESVRAVEPDLVPDASGQ